MTLDLTSSPLFFLGGPPALIFFFAVLLFYLNALRDSAIVLFLSVRICQQWESYSQGGRPSRRQANKQAGNQAGRQASRQADRQACKRACGHADKETGHASSKASFTWLALSQNRNVAVWPKAGPRDCRTTRRWLCDPHKQVDVRATVLGGRQTMSGLAGSTNATLLF